jgi:hypothetical protein
MGDIPSWLETEFENGNLELARLFAIELLDGKAYSCGTLAECYYFLQSNGESMEASESWINLFWSRIASIPPTQWLHAMGSDKSFIKFVYGFWGKDV